MVRLLLISFSTSRKIVRSFNPTMVRLLLGHKLLNHFPHPCFNPTMVRLLREVRVIPVEAFPGFNPTMVRLLRKNTRLCPTVSKKFQSHNGAIAALVRSQPLARAQSFQSHNGAIAAYAKKPPFVKRPCFNPTMVRLLLCLQQHKHDRCQRFQSHNGAIAAMLRPTKQWCRHSFQSHNGAIAAV